MEDVQELFGYNSRGPLSFFLARWLGRHARGLPTRVISLCNLTKHRCQTETAYLQRVNISGMKTRRHKLCFCESSADPKGHTFIQHTDDHENFN